MAVDPTLPTFPTEVSKIDVEGVGKKLGDGIAKSLLPKVTSDMDESAVAALLIRALGGILNAIAPVSASIIGAIDKLEERAGPGLLQVAVKAIEGTLDQRIDAGALGIKGGAINADQAGRAIGDAILAAVDRDFSAGAATDPDIGAANARRVFQITAKELFEDFASGYVKGVIEHYVMTIPDAGDLVLKLSGFEAQAQKVIAAQLEHLVHAPYERFLNRKFQDKLLSVRQLVRALGAKRITPEFFYEEMAQQGYSQSRADAVVAEESDHVSVGDVRALVRGGYLDQAQARARLVWIGYPEDEAAELAQLMVNDRLAPIAEATATEAVRQFVDGTLSEAELENLLRSAHYSPAEVEAEMGLARLKQRDAATLPAGAVEEAYMVGDISLGRLSDYYRRRQYAPEDAYLLERRAIRKKLDYEEEQKKREERDKAGATKRPSLGTQESAFRLGILSAAALQDYYRDLGYDEAGVALAFAVQERAVEDAAKAAAARAAKEAAAMVRRLPAAALRDAYVRGLADRGQLAELLDASGLAPGDRDVYLATADQLKAEREAAAKEAVDRRKPKAPRPVSVADAEEAFYSRLWSGDQLAQLYRASGFGPEAVGVMLQLATAERDRRDAEAQAPAPGTIEPGSRRPGQSAMERAFRAGLVTEAQLLADYEARGYTAADGRLLLALLKAGAAPPGAQ